MRLEGDESLRIHTELTFKWVHSKALREHSSMGLYIVRTYKHNATGGNQADCGQKLRSEGKSLQVVTESSGTNLKRNKQITLEDNIPK